MAANEKWTPIRTKPRQEKKLSRYCRVNKIPHYLPLVHKVHNYGKRDVSFSSPMFPGYIFCRVSEDTFSSLQLSNAVVYKIDIDDYSEKTLIKELKNIRIFEKMSASRDIEISPQLTVGTPVEITRGPFQGISGIVKKIKNRLMLIISVEMLGQAAAVEINSRDLQKL